MTFDTMTLRERTGKRRVRLPHDRDKEVYYYNVTRQDAEIIIRDLGKLPQGGSTCDRLMDDGRPLNDCTMDPEDRELHYWIHNGPCILKRIRYDGTITDELNVHTKGWRGDHTPIVSARIEGGLFIVETESTEYEIVITDNPKEDMCNYIDEPYDPTIHTEHLLICALNHGVTPAEVSIYTGIEHCVSINSYSPFMRDHTTGEMVPSRSFDAIYDLAKKAGVHAAFSQDVIPFKPYIYPSAYWRYCNRRLIGACKKKRDECVCCHGFYGRPEVEISPKDRPKAGNKKTLVRCVEVDA